MRYFTIFASISISLALANNGVDVIESVFDFCDRKGTDEGLLTLAEVEEYQCMDFLRSALGILDEDIARDFEAIDENGDGVVSKQESFTAFQALDIDRFKSFGPPAEVCEIERFYTGSGTPKLTKMLVATGSPIDTVVVSEVIDLLDPSNVCETKDGNAWGAWGRAVGDFQARQGVGGLLKNSRTSGLFSRCKRNGCAPSPLVCAAHWTSSRDWETRCFVVGGSDEVVELLQTERRFAASVKYDDETLWATGGLTDSADILEYPLATTELVTANGENPGTSNYGPELPLALWGHCIVAIDDDSFIVAGGNTGSFTASKSTYIYEKKTEEWTEGPQMSAERSHLQCGSFKSDAHRGGYHNVVVAVGGISKQGVILDTVEIYDPLNSEAGWVKTASLPTPLAYFSLIRGPTGCGVLANGGYNGTHRQTAIYELTCPDSGCLWTENEQKLKVPRINHVSMLITDCIASCSKDCKDPEWWEFWKAKCRGC